MEDTLPIDRLARALGELLAEHNGQNVAVLDLREMNMWTDFFVIATVTSRIHAEGLLKSLWEFSRSNGVEIWHGRRKAETGAEWNLVDFGPVVVHLMSEKARDFYELERLWGPVAARRETAPGQGV
ncbi:MAG: ribosome silencing factor [Spirochaetaceae bacterium]|jgi:ribosome-associated protein|nr:ribosome silencing factor [Spirochaetaceae bacterium]